jgi:hypothetical protein
MSPEYYDRAAKELARQILALIPDHPEILDMTDPWGLFKVPGFRGDYLASSLAMAEAVLRKALEEAKAEYLAMRGD